LSILEIYSICNLNSKLVVELRKSFDKFLEDIRDGAINILT